MKRHSCFLIGHRDTSPEIYPQLLREIEHHILHFGVTDFYVGHYGSFDSMAAGAVSSLKSIYPRIRLYLLLPYHPAERPFPLPDGFDNTYFPEGQESVPRRFSIPRANMHMVRTCEYLLCHVKHPASGAGKILEYALKRLKCGLIRVTNLSL